MTNNTKVRSDKANVVIAALLILLILVPFCGLVIWALVDERKRAEALKPTANATLLPIIAGPFKQDKFIVHELEHGWMVRREGGVGGSLTFVPKPSKQE